MSIDRWDVAVIGGGAIGLSVARQLAHAGQTVVVLEREAATGQGSSARANGGFRAQFTTAINITFSLYSIAELEQLNRSSGGVVGLHQTGYLLFTGDEERAQGLRAAYELQRSLGVDTEWLTAEQVVERAPLMRREGLLAGTFHKRDGFLDPHGLVSALKTDAQRHRAEIRTRCEVTAIEPSRTGPFVVRAGDLSLEADRVVNAAGAHARGIAAFLGVDVPVEPVRRNLAFIPHEDRSLIPMCVDLDTGVLLRRETGGGYVIAYSDPNDEPGWDALVDPRWLEEVAERIGNRFPSIASLPIDPHHCWAGLYPETPDHHAIIGAPPEHDRFVQCVGFGGHGLMHAPAAGKAVAELITEGTCSTFDLNPLRPTRFADGDLVEEVAVF